MEGYLPSITTSAGGTPLHRSLRSHIFP